MKQYTLLSSGMAMLLILFACEKKDNNASLKDSASYFPITQGSYWVYDTYKIDSAGNETVYSKNDTMRIIGDTTFENGNDYSIMYGKYMLNTKKKKSFYRDSSGYTINDKGNVVVYPKDYTSKFNLEYPVWSDSLIYYYNMLEDYLSTIKINVNTVDELLNFKLFIFRIADDKESEICTLNNLFAKDIGRVVHQITYLHGDETSKTYYEARLVDYYIAPAKN
jgi:hypothetical protein